MDEPNSATTLELDDPAKGPLIVTAVVFWVLPVLVLLMTWVATPGYIGPFLNHPVARIMLLGSLSIHTLLCGLLGLSSSLKWHIAIKITFVVLSAISMVIFGMIPILGPALVTIMQALGPAI